MLKKSLPGSQIFIKEDVPPEVESRVNKLLPIFLETKKDKDLNAKMVVDKLYINNQVYTVDTIKNLPEVLQPEHSANKTNGEITLFWNKDSFLTNFNLSKFEKDGVTYCCNEQYVTSQKALLFQDVDAHNKNMESENPAEMKHICVQNYDHGIWKRSVHHEGGSTS